MSRLSMKAIRRALFVLGALALVAACAVAVYAYHIRRRAAELVHISYVITQQGSRPTIHMLQRYFGSALKQTDACENQACGYSVQVTNRILAFLRLAPYTGLGSSFWVKDGIVELDDVISWTETREKNQIGVGVSVQYCDRCSRFRIGPWSDSAPLNSNGAINITNTSTAANLRAALGMDPGCIVSFRGCTSIAELLPTAWERTTDQTIRCRIPNRNGVVDNATAP